MRLQIQSPKDFGPSFGMVSLPFTNSRRMFDVMDGGGLKKEAIELKINLLGYSAKGLQW